MLIEEEYSLLELQEIGKRFSHGLVENMYLEDLER